MLTKEEKKKHVKREIPRFINKINENYVPVKDRETVSMMLINLMDHVACKGKILSELEVKGIVKRELVHDALISDIKNHVEVIFLFCIRKTKKELEFDEVFKLNEMKTYIGIRIATLLQELM